MAEQTEDNQERLIKDAVQQFVDAQLEGQKPDLDEFVKQYPDYEHKIRRMILNIQKIDTLFDSLVQTDEGDFEDTATGQDLVGWKVGNFEITEIIGRGGMGVVYLARDIRLKRSVAIKSMPAQLKNDSTARTRFRREAELLASLNHPNIAIIHDIIEQEDVTGYLVLEYVPGETLTERIKREPLKLEEALSIARQIAEAVSAAHKKGIIHRDLKPGNIKLTQEGRVKVLDFGLAKSSVNKGADIEITSTEPGRIIGTPAYMSPEQARGKPVDHRTDIWSFGCLFYEMLTGHLPFEGETATDTLARIIERQPDWELLPNETPDNVRVLLKRCLEKDPEHRLNNIADAAIAIRETLSRPASSVLSLWRWAMVIGLVVIAIVVGLRIDRWRDQTLAGPGRIESLAVLPLENLTGDPNQEYFSDGMTDVLITELSKMGALRVISRTSVMRYKETDKTLPEIARELDVDAIVEGSVLRVAKRVSFTVQLINAEPEEHLWAENYDRDFSKIWILWSEVARSIASKIEVTLTPDQEARLASSRPINPETYVAYLKGMFHLNKMTPEGTKKGLDYLRTAIEKDPSDPLAYGGLALGYVASAHGPGAPPNAMALGEATAIEALELDQTIAEAYAALAQIKLYRDWDWEAAEKAFQRALKLNPSLTMTRAHYSWYLQLFGYTDEAFAQMRRAQEEDPLVPIYSAWLATQYLWAGQNDPALREVRKSLELDPDFPYGLSVIGEVYAAKEMYEEAIKAHQRAAELSDDWKSGLGCTYARAGRQDEVRLVLAELEADPTLWDTFFIAQIYAALDEKNKAFRWLEKAYGPPNHPYLPWIKYPLAFKPLHDDPRFGDLLRRMNLPE